MGAPDKLDNKSYESPPQLGELASAPVPQLQEHQAGFGMLTLCPEPYSGTLHSGVLAAGQPFLPGPSPAPGLYTFHLAVSLASIFRQVSLPSGVFLDPFSMTLPDS